MILTVMFPATTLRILSPLDATPGIVSFLRARKRRRKEEERKELIISGKRIGDYSKKVLQAGGVVNNAYGAAATGDINGMVQASTGGVGQLVGGSAG